MFIFPQKLKLQRLESIIFQILKLILKQCNSLFYFSRVVVFFQICKIKNVICIYMLENLVCLWTIHKSQLNAVQKCSPTWTVATVKNPHKGIR